MHAWQWLDVRGVPGGVLVMWLGSLPVTSSIAALIHRAEKRHRQHVAAINRLTAAYLARPPKE